MFINHVSLLEVKYYKLTRTNQNSGHINYPEAEVYLFSPQLLPF